MNVCVRMLHQCTRGSTPAEADEHKHTRTFEGKGGHHCAATSRVAGRALLLHNFEEVTARALARGYLGVSARVIRVRVCV